jgi:hypothetical protein
MALSGPHLTLDGDVMRCAHCRIEPYWIKTAPAAPLARRQRPGLSLGEARPGARRAAQRGRRSSGSCVTPQPVASIAVFLAPDCPARGHRVKGGPPSRRFAQNP